METENLISDFQPSTSRRVIAAAGPVLWIAVSYVDPGKWAAAVEGGARFGYDLVLLVLLINCATILCQYLSARVAIATGKDLAQICSEEYDGVTCILLGIEAEISMISLDLTLVLGTAYGLNVIFGFDLFNCIFLTCFDAVVFPCLTSLLGNLKAKFFSICLASFILVYYFFGVLLSQPESSLSMSGMLNKLTGENAYALMGLLGANIMPHNFYLHSSVAQQDLGLINTSKVAMCHDHFFATVCIFSGIFLVNCMLISLAANAFNSGGLASLTSQDATSLLEQVFRSSLASISLTVIVFFSDQLISLTWCLGRQVIIKYLFRRDIPGWLHRATIRIMAVIPALYCVWNSGAEGVFQLLVFTQVVIALLLPSSVIPLFRVASSRSIMGTFKSSLLVEFLALLLFVAMLGLKLVFVMEMIFGNSDWVSSLKWNIEGGIPSPYITLLMAAFASSCLMLFLAITPLKSTKVVVHSVKQDEKLAIPACIERHGSETREVKCGSEKAMEKPKSMLLFDKSSGNQQLPNTSIPNPDQALPETPLDSENSFDLTTVQEKPETTFFSPALDNLQAPSLDNLASTESGLTIESEPVNSNASDVQVIDKVEKPLKIVGDIQNVKDDEPSPQEQVESTKDVSECSQSLMTSEGPGSYRSITDKFDGAGSDAGSLSQIYGLGRAARRQLTVALDEFWGQLFDFHGQPIHEAKAKKLDILLGVDSKSSSPPVRLDSMAEQFAGSIPSAGGTGTDSFRTLNFCNRLKQQVGQSIVGSPCGVQNMPSTYSNMRLSYACMQNFSHSTYDSSEKRYYSVHVPAASDGYNQQPLTVHGYDFRASLGQIGKEKGSDGLKDRLESIRQNSTSSVKPSPPESYGRPLGLKPQVAPRTLVPPGFHNVPVSRNSSLKTERQASQGVCSQVSVNNSNSPPYAKKFYSLPDISGLYVPQRDSSLPCNTSQHDKSMIYGKPITQPMHEQKRLGPPSWSGTALAHNEVTSPSMVCREAFSLKYDPRTCADSLWSKQPYEQFGLDKSPSKFQGAALTVDVGAKLLQSFRSCIRELLKLEGSDSLFRQNEGIDEAIIYRVASREKILYEVESMALDRKVHEADQSKYMSVPHCGDECVWSVDLIISFGVWCIHKILDLSLVERRPELWGKYTYVLNRLQGIIDPAFWKPRTPTASCFCLNLSLGNQQKPPSSQMVEGKFTTAPMLLELIKDVENAISGRKGRTGTAAGDVAFPKGKENIAAVLKRYKRRLSNKPVMPLEPGVGSGLEYPLHIACNPQRSTYFQQSMHLPLTF